MMPEVVVRPPSIESTDILASAKPNSDSIQWRASLDYVLLASNLNASVESTSIRTGRGYNSNKIPRVDSITGSPIVPMASNISLAINPLHVDNTLGALYIG